MTNKYYQIFKHALKTLTKHGSKPRLYTFHYEAYVVRNKNKKFFDLEQKPLPPHMPQKGEKGSIQTLKKKIISDLCSTDNGFSLQLLDTILLQKILTLKILLP